MAMDAAMPSAQRRKAAPFMPCAVSHDAMARLVPARAQGRGRVRSAATLSRKRRQDFLDALMLCGDPALCAEQVGISLARVVRLRAVDAEFAREWQAAMGFAWERVEHRLLAHLLDSAAAFDSKLALAAIGRRDQSPARAQARPVDSESVARVRAELRALVAAHAAGGATDE